MSAEDMYGQTYVPCEYCGDEIITPPDPEQFFAKMSHHWTTCSGVPKIDQMELWEMHKAKIVKFKQRAKDRAKEFELSRTDKSTEYKRIEKFWDDKLDSLKENWL